MTDHDTLRDDLALLAAGDLEAEPRALLDAHLATCPECRAELEELRATVALLRPESVPETDLSDFYEARLAPFIGGPVRKPLGGFGALLLRLAALVLAFAAGFHVRSTLPPDIGKGPGIEARQGVEKESDRERLARAWRASASGESGLSRAVLALAALEKRR